MKRLILFEILILFLATTFESDSPPGWFQQTIPRADVIIQDIFFVDSLNGWTVSQRNPGGDTSFIFNTTDGGANWSIQFQDKVVLNAMSFIDNNTGYCVGTVISPPRGIVKKTTNGGINWFTSALLTIGLFRDVQFVNKDTGWICSGDSFGGGIIKTMNGGVNWILQVGDTTFPNKLSFINKDTGWVCSNDVTGRLFRTTNGGNNWNLQYTFSNNLRNILFLDRDIGYVVGGFGSYSISKTTNGGFSWQSTTNSTGGIGLYFVNHLTGYNCAGASILQKSTDGGSIWFNQTVPAGGYVSIQFTDTSKGWSGGSILIHTTDGGGPVGIHQISNEVSSEYELYQNYPNPFNPKTNIKYQIINSSYIQLIIYDITGREITKLVDKEQNTGTYLADWNAVGFSSGIYFYSLIIDGVTIETRKMLMIK